MGVIVGSGLELIIAELSEHELCPAVKLDIHAVVVAMSVLEIVLVERMEEVGIVEAVAEELGATVETEVFSSADGVATVETEVLCLVVKVDESAVETEVFCLLDTADAGVSTEGLRLIVKGRAVSLATAETGMFTTGGVQSNEEIVTDSNDIEATNSSLFKEVVVGGQEAHVLIADKGKET